MSHSYNARKKAARRLLDQLNPERIRIRRLIRTGVLPRRAFRKDAGGSIIMRWAGPKRVYAQTWQTVDVFTAMTSQKKAPL